MIAPASIRRIDPGAEHYQDFENGDTAWLCVIKPPSGIEQDIVYIVQKNGTVRPATDADFTRK